MKKYFICLLLCMFVFGIVQAEDMVGKIGIGSNFSSLGCRYWIMNNVSIDIVVNGWIRDDRYRYTLIPSILYSIASIKNFNLTIFGAYDYYHFWSYSKGASINSINREILGGLGIEYIFNNGKNVCYSIFLPGLEVNYDIENKETQINLRNNHLGFRIYF